ncbi:Multifunctional conjugation protein TraI [Methylobacterium dankookense]|uniref:ATP-dependent RecD-like DNA helicase n=2 Tax=Methylobacterium dankookense TaxID=560405 RepID=A0A564G097_9HYPH|nr:ATP-dependent RecD-like DNA helicase [Methylobacterium dankookense]VUF13647.1 Multifunctional conjugation protein TraI [Methylobacterium dankookense]
MTCTRITSVEYYESMARQIRREAGLSAPDSPLDDTAAAYARKVAAGTASEGAAAFEEAYTEAFDRALATLRWGHTEGRDQVAYYTDNGAGEANGVWWTRGSKASPSDPADPFRSCPDGAEVDGRVLRDLAAGRNPQSLKPLVRASANGRRSVGYDLQFAAPKSVSVLAAFAGPEERARILAAHDRAVRRALDYAHEAGLIVTRTGAQGRERAPAGGVSAAVYRHFTSRAQDPHLHSHAVLLNLCVRADGTTGGLDNREILLNAGGIAALYRSELAEGLRAELGCEAVRSGRNFEVAGVAEPVLELFSKRRMAIERAAQEQGFDTADDRVAAQAAAFDTRAAKDRERPLTSLEAEWDRQLVQSGWTRAALFEGVQIAADGIRDTRAGAPAERLQRLAEAGLAATLEMQAVLAGRELVRLTAEALQCEAGADAVLEQVERMRQDGRVVEVGRSAEGRPVYATPAMIAVEQTMLRVAYARQDERAFVPAEVVTRVLADRPSLRPEQRAAVRHALNRDGVSVVEGSAGSGKSYAMASVAEAVRACDGEVWVIAPSWKAVDVIRNDTATAEAMARAVTGFLNRIDKGEIALGPRAVVIADEAGMIGTRDLAALVEATAVAGAKLVLSGDTRQLVPVPAGAPMRLLVRALGTSRMDEIQRQRGRSEAEGAWMRAASIDFAAGRTASALEAYDRGGAINWGANREATIQALVDAYVDSRLDLEGAERTRAVLTGWNKDVRELNARIRARLKREGLLPEGEDVEIVAIPRGGGRAEALALTVGDEVIFGESVKIGDQTIRNADLARVEAISGDPTDPVLTLRLVKNGVRLSALSSALVGSRKPGEPRVPRLQHSYAMTTHAAQGVTVDEAYVADLRGAGAEATYVAMTRHRRTVRLYVDTARIRDRLEAARSGVRPEERGLPGGREAAHPKIASIGQSEIRQAFLSDAARSGGKANVADFAGADLRTWCDAPAQVRAIPLRRDGRMGLERAGSWKEAISGIAPASVGTPSPAAQSLRRRMGERLNAPAAYPVPRPSRAGRALPFASDTPRRHGRIGQLAAILWQGLRREIRIAATAIRGLLPLTLERLRADVLIDPRGRIVFARRDQSGRLSGIEQIDGTGEGVEKGQQGTTGLIQLGDRRSPKRIYVARTQTEALSLYQQDGQPDRALIYGLGGDGPETGSALAHVVARYPAADVHLAIDARADEGEAQAFEAWVLAALRKAQTPEARVTVRRSTLPELFSDRTHDVSADPISNEKDRKRQRRERTGQDRGMERQLSFARSTHESYER